MQDEKNLCDYLWHRDGSSFGRLLPKKRLWYSLKESGQLLFYKNKESFTKNGEYGVIELRGAEVYKSSQANSFRLETSFGKKHMLTTENTTYLEIWISGLNRCINKMKSWDAYQGTWGEEEEIRYDEDEHIDEEEDIVFPANHCDENKCSETINSQTSTPVPIRSGSDAGIVMFERVECTIEFPQSPIAVNPGIIRSRANQCVSPASASGDTQQNNSKSQSSECLDQASARDSYLASICRSSISKDNQSRALAARWQEAYVVLLQTTLTLFGRTDDLSSEAIDRVQHRDNLATLLDESRTRDQSLPCLDILTDNIDMYTDEFGFRHRFSGDERPLLAYACEKLREHFSSKRRGVEWEKLWNKVLEGEKPLTPTVTLKVMCRQGVPKSVRTVFWKRLFYTRAMDIKNSRGLHYYNRIEQQVERLVATPISLDTCENSKQIAMDLCRTIPENVYYSNAKAKGISDLRKVLESFCIHNPVIGYCQGMNFIVAVLLLFLDSVEDTFWALVAITERYFTLNYFDGSLSGALADQKVLKYIIECKLPRLHSHMEILKVDLSSVTFNWFLTLFYDAVPFATMTRIWDCFFLEGPKDSHKPVLPSTRNLILIYTMQQLYKYVSGVPVKSINSLRLALVLLRFSVAILRWNENSLLRQADMISFLRFLKISTRHMYDVDLLFKLAFESLEPFPKRCELLERHRSELRCIRGELLMNCTSDSHNYDLASKSNHIHNASGKRRRNSREERILGIHYGYIYEFAVKWMEKEVWLCETAARNSKIVVIRVDKCSTSTTRIQIDSRIMCSAAMENCFVVGTLSWKLLVYDFRMRKLQWSKDLSDTPLCLCATSGYCSERKNTITTLDTTIFVGLASGSVAVCICKSKHINEEVEPLYLTIGRHAITAVVMVNKDEYLWASCEDEICVISPKTLEIKHRFTVGPDKQIRSMTYTTLGVWVTIRRSQCLSLWSTKGKPYYLSSYEIGTNTNAEFMQMDNYHSVYEITAIEVFTNMLWIGTADGHLCIYKLKEELKQKVSCNSNTMKLKLPPHRKKQNKYLLSSSTSEDIPYSTTEQSSSCVSSPSPPPMLNLPLRRVNTEPKRARSNNEMTLIMPTNRVKSAAEPRISLVRGSSCKRDIASSKLMRFKGRIYHQNDIFDLKTISIQYLTCYSDSTPLTFSSEGDAEENSEYDDSVVDSRGRYTFSVSRSMTATSSSPWDIVGGSAVESNQYFPRPPVKTTRASLASRMRISDCAIRAIVALSGRQRAVITVTGSRSDRWALLRWTPGKDDIWRSTIVKQPSKEVRGK